MIMAKLYFHHDVNGIIQGACCPINTLKKIQLHLEENINYFVYKLQKNMDYTLITRSDGIDGTYFISNDEYNNYCHE